MTPKLYDEVSTKLANVWGEYAGWAHSVGFDTLRLRWYAGSFTYVPTGIIHLRPEVFRLLWPTINAFDTFTDSGQGI